MGRWIGSRPSQWKGPGVRMTPVKSRAQQDQEAADKRAKEAKRQRDRRAKQKQQKKK